ncbi:MAG: hypothetical protein WBD81_17920 [Collimonas pratensis]|uniref:hypothetical protein n=1 Tax=Collimonas pratensis TaxID=279113 RepID=UPI003C78FD01
MTLKREVNPGILKPGMHRVLSEVAPGQWQIVGDTGQDLSLLQIDVASQHAIGMQSANMMIVDSDSKVTTKFENYKPLPQIDGAPITPENQRIRDRWVAAIILWLTPSELRNAEATPENQQAVRNALKKAKIEISLSGNGTEAIIFRNGEPLASWMC